MATENSSLVRGGRDDSARTIVADQHGVAAQRWIIERFDRREECVHVNVEYGSAGVHARSQHKPGLLAIALVPTVIASRTAPRPEKPWLLAAWVPCVVCIVATARRIPTPQAA